MAIKPYLIIFFTLITLGPARLGWAETPGQDENLYQQIQELRQLKEKDPEAFRRKIEEKKAYIQKEYSQLNKQPDSERQRFQEKEKSFRQARLQFFKESHPQMFQQFQNRRMQAAERIQQQNPQAFKQFMENHPHLRERFEERQKAFHSNENKQGTQNFRQPEDRNRQENQERPRFRRDQRQERRQMRNGMKRPRFNRRNGGRRRENSQGNRFGSPSNEDIQKDQGPQDQMEQGPGQSSGFQEREPRFRRRQMERR